MGYIMAAATVLFALVLVGIAGSPPDRRGHWECPKGTYLVMGVDYVLCVESEDAQWVKP